MTPSLCNDKELAFLKKHKFLPRRDLHARFVKRFNRTDINLQQIKSICTDRGWSNGKNKASPGTARLRAGLIEVRQPSAAVWRTKHRLMWEELFGPIPKGSVLLPLNGDKFDFDPFNWVMLTQSMANRLRQSPFFDGPPELRPAIFAAARLKQAVEDRMGKRFR